MPTTKASQKAVSKYRKKNYDMIQISVPRGQRDVIKLAADAAGESVNAYIKKAITERMDRDNKSGRTE